MSAMKLKYSKAKKQASKVLAGLQKDNQYLISKYDEESAMLDFIEFFKEACYKKPYIAAIMALEKYDTKFPCKKAYSEARQDWTLFHCQVTLKNSAYVCFMVGMMGEEYFAGTLSRTRREPVLDFSTFPTLEETLEYISEANRLILVRNVLQIFD